MKNLTMAIAASVALVGCNANTESDSQVDVTNTPSASPIASASVTPVTSVTPVVSNTAVPQPTDDIIIVDPTTTPTTVPSTTPTSEPTPVPLSIAAINDQVVDEDSWMQVQIPVIGEGFELTASASAKVVSFSVNGRMLQINPVANFNGDVTITVQATRGKEVVSESFQLTVNPVNDLPKLLNGPTITLPENSTTELQLQSSDVDEDSVTYQLLVQPKYGTASIQDGMLFVTPNNGFTGIDSIVVRLNDGQENNDESVTLNVIAVNDKPTFTIDTNIEMLAGTAQVVPFKIVDPDSSPVVTVDSQNLNEIEVTVDQFTNQLTITPKEGFHGNSLFTLLITDKEHTAYVQVWAQVAKQWTAWSFDNRIYRTDGTNFGTGELKVFANNPNNMLHTSMQTVYFSATPTGGSNDELWVTDGSSAGTEQVLADTAVKLVMPRNLVEYNGKVYFTAQTASNDAGKPATEIWQADGNTATRLVQHRYRSTSEFNNLYVHNDRLYFTANNLDGLFGREVFYYDFAQQDVDLLKDINQGNKDGVKDWENTFFGWQGELCFTATGIDENFELWCSDGTSNGTYLANDLNGLASSGARGYTQLGSALYYVANDGEHGIELWELKDGRSTRITDINTTGNSFATRGIPAVDAFSVELNAPTVDEDLLHFVATDGTTTHRYEYVPAWGVDQYNPAKLDEAYAGANMVKVVNGHRVFVNSLGTLSASGSPGKLGKTIAPGFNTPWINELYFAKPVINDTWLFTGLVSNTEQAPWRTNGVGATTCTLYTNLCGEALIYQ